MVENALCPCGSGRDYAQCCEPFHQGKSVPLTAEQLMRSRYSAYKKKLATYLLETWAETTRPGQIEFDADIQWVKLNIMHCRKGRAQDSKGWVTFVAHYEQQGKRFEMQEKSEFIRNAQGRWVYLKGEVRFLR
jgi:SEC-C motif-containing protein